MKFAVRFLCPLVTLLLLQSCEKKGAGEEITICPAFIPPAYADFKVVSAQTNEDLFFSNQPRYKVNDLYFFKIQDILRKDTIRPDVLGAGAARYFKIRLVNTSLRDTLVLKIADLPDDRFIYTLKKTEEPCPNYGLDKAFLNNKELAIDDGKLILKK